MRPIRRLVSVLTLAAVALTLFASMPFDSKYPSVTALSIPHFVVVDLASPPAAPAVDAVLAAAPMPAPARVAMLSPDQASLARHNTEIAGALHAAGLAQHSQPRAQAKV